MKTLAVSLIMALFVCPAAFADTETHTVSYQSLITDPDQPRLIFPGFDDMNGQRTLTGVDVRVQANVSATISVENMTANTLTDWAVEGEHLVIAGFKREEPESFGPFAFLGGLNIAPFTGTLLPNDGTPGSGPDFLAHSESTPIDVTNTFEPEFLEFFNGPGEIVGFAGPFTEFLLDNLTMWDPDNQTGDATVGFTELTQTGSLSLVYTYDTVPEPTSALACAGIVLLATRRHRRDRHARLS
jgi:hypothetical protein